MVRWLNNALGAMLAWFESWTGSYAIALLFYALVFKVLFLPFAIKQQKNQIAMAHLTPKIYLIKAKYRGRNDRVTQQKMQQEIMELQQKEGYSPLSGCLPMLVQLPLLIILFQVIRYPLSHITKMPDTLIGNFAVALGEHDEVKLISKLLDPANAEIVSTITSEGKYFADYAAKIPNFNLWGLNLADIPRFTSILILIPFIAAGLQWFTMWVTRKFNSNSMTALQGQDPQTQMSMKIMDVVFPLMTLWIALKASAMLGLYWIYQSIFAIVQTIIISKTMPLPQYTEEEIKAMKKAARQQEKAQRAALKTQPKYRSLHYIDEDDYEELPEIKTQNPTTNTNKSFSEKPEIKD